MYAALNPVEPKSPAESKVYTLDWTPALNPGATVSTSSWGLSPNGLTNIVDGIVTGSHMTSIQLSGGVAGTDYQATNTIVTSDGETLQRTGTVQVREL